MMAAVRMTAVRIARNRIERNRIEGNGVPEKAGQLRESAEDLRADSKSGIRNFCLFALSQPALELGHAALDVEFLTLLLDDVVAVAAEEVVDGFDADANGPGRLVFIEVFEGEVGRAGPLDDAFDDAVDGRVVSAFEARHLERHEIGMARRKLGRPDLGVGAGGIPVLPDVFDVERMRDESASRCLSQRIA